MRDDMVPGSELRRYIEKCSRLQKEVNQLQEEKKGFLQIAEMYVGIICGILITEEAVESEPLVLRKETIRDAMENYQVSVDYDDGVYRMVAKKRDEG